MPTFPPEQYKLLQDVFDTFAYVMCALQNAKTSLKRFRQMLFGAKTESKDKVLGKTDASAAGDARAGAGTEDGKIEPLANTPAAGVRQCRVEVMGVTLPKPMSTHPSLKSMSQI